MGENELDIQIRPYQKGDEKHLSAIMEKIYLRKFNDEYWWWKYLNNPLGYHFCYCALLDGRIVGFAGGIPYRLKWKDREVTGAQLTDLAVEPDLRGKKVFSSLKMVSTADICAKADAYYGFTNEDSYRAYRQVPGADYVFHVPRMTRILNATAFIRQRIPSNMIASAGGAAVNAVLSVGARLLKKGVTSRITVRAAEAFDPTMDPFLEAVSAPVGIMHIRDHRYLNWRYVQNPIHRHAIYIAEEEGRIVGLTVLNDESDNTIRRGTILEFLTYPGREDAQGLLLGKAMDHFRERGVNIVIAWVFPHSPYYRAFRRHLFIRRRGDLIVLTTTTRKNDDLKNDLKNPRNWHVSCGDHEAF